MKSHIVLIGLLVVVANCARSGDDAAANDSISGRPSGLQVTAAGIGPLRAGMPLAQGEAALRTSLAAPAGIDSAQCRFVQWIGGPPGLRVMVENNVIARVDVDSGSVETAEGARIGDSEDRIRSLYGNRVTVTPHKYTSGAHYLTVTPAEPADSAFRIVFETDGQRVTRYRAGKRPQVEYVEGCG